MKPLLWLWAARDILRHPRQAILLGAALTALVAMIAAALLWTQALADTTAILLRRSPALVIRRVTGGGWAPLLTAESLAAVQTVPGVTAARVRIWGTASGPAGPVTVIGVTPAQRDFLRQQQLPIPGMNQAVVGPGIPVPGPGSNLSLTGRSRLQCSVIGFLNPQTAIVSADTVLLDAADARKLLGIPEGYASDLTVEVFHEEEQQAIIPDLAAALPWPVRITTRTAALRTYTAGYTRRGGIAALTLIPAILALAFIVSGTIMAHTRRKRETGLLKTLGWTTGDIVRLQIFRALLIAVPAASLGFFTAYALVFWSASGLPGYLLFGWHAHPPGLLLRFSSAVLVLLEVSALAVLPFLLATFGAALRTAMSDPQELLEGDPL